MDSNQNNGTVNRIDVSGINLNPKSTNLVLGIVMLIVGVLFEIGAISMDIEAKIVAVIVLNVIFILPILFYGFAMVYAHFVYKKAIFAAIEKYGEANILENMSACSIRIHKEPYANKLVFFTNTFIVAPGTAIITYDEISQMYKEETNTKQGVVKTLSFNLLDGRSYSLCKHITDEELGMFISLCCGFNQNILVGFTDENNAIHEKRVEQYKM